jgi:hypothetical protein
MASMSRLRTRRVFVFLAVGLVLFAAFVPAAAASLPVAVLNPLWLILPAVTITLIRRQASRCDDEPTSLLALVASRAPPSTVAFA